MTAPSLRRTAVGRGRKVLVAGLAGVACLATPALAGADDSGRTADVQRALDRIVAAGAPGAAAVVRDGERTIRVASGIGDRASATPMRVEDRVRIGGVSKSFTATVVLQLVADGRLALEDTVEHRLPGVISNGGAISIRRLLNHTSGIYNYSADPAVLAPYEAGDLTRPFDPLEGVRIAAAHGPLFSPGTQLSYSNTNYLLLAMIVEAVTGRPFATELEARIVAPLRLRSTSYVMSSDIDGPHAHGYLLLDEELVDVTPLSPSLFGAAGAILSNADDVARFYRALLQRRLLPPHLLREMQTIDPVATGGIPDAGILGGGWGLGLLRETFPCGEAWGHDAENPGYMTAAWSTAHGTRQVAIVVNSSWGHDDAVSRAMRAALVTAYCPRHGRRPHPPTRARRPAR